MSILYCSTEDHRLNIDEKPVLASGSRNVDYMQVKLDDTWTSLENVTFHANFYMTEENSENGYISDLQEVYAGLYRCVIPSMAYMESGRMYFGVFAKNANEEIVKTSTVKYMRIKQGIPTDTDEPPDPYIYGMAIRKMYVDTMNSILPISLSYDDDEATIGLMLQQMIDGQISQDDYNAVVSALRDLSNDYVTNPTQISDPAWIDYQIDVDNFCATVISSLTNLYGGE